jgi:hypothetical protein
MILQPAIAQDIWFGPSSRSQEFMDLFKLDAPWRAAASHVRAFEISQTFGFMAPKDDLAQMFGDLQRRHIDLVIGLLALSGTGPNHCGYRVEGYSAPGGVDALVHRIRALGGEPRHFALDEPLYFGHVFSRERDLFGCHSSIAEIANDVANKVRQIHAVFPTADIGDVEPIFALRDAEIEEWLTDYEAKTGTKLSFMRFDMDWKSPWQARISSISQLLRRKDVAMQVIYNGSGLDQSDEQWIAHAGANFRTFETSVTSPPAAVMIQSWNVHPTHLLPESDSRTLTGFVDQYVEWRRSRH